MSKGAVRLFSRVSPSTGEGSPTVHGFYDAASGSCQYLCVDEGTGNAALIDIVRDFDPASAATRSDTAEAILGAADRLGVEIAWILDTHPHADHLTAADWLRGRTGAPTAIGEKTAEIAALWRDLYNLPGAFDLARDFDRLFADGDVFRIGDLQTRVMLSPGHTLGSITFVVGDAAFVHDTLMHVDSGTARADFPGGSASALFHSIQGILDLPGQTRLFVGHDYGTDDREVPAWEASVADHRARNVHVGGGTSEEEFVDLREKRDATLDLPDRMLFALQVNLRGGRLPPAESDGHSYFKIPANRF